MRLFVFLFWWLGSALIVGVVNYQCRGVAESFPLTSYLLSTLIVYSAGHFFGNDE